MTRRLKTPATNAVPVSSLLPPPVQAVVRLDRIDPSPFNKRVFRENDLQDEEPVSFVRWAITRGGFNPLVASFLRWKPDYLLDSTRPAHSLERGKREACFRKESGSFRNPSKVFRNVSGSFPNLSGSFENLSGAFENLSGGLLGDDADAGARCAMLNRCGSA